MSEGLILYYALGVFAVFTVSAVMLFLQLRVNIKLPRGIFYGCILFSVYMMIAQILKYHTLHALIDFSHWTQVLNSIIMNGKPLSLSVDFLVPGTMNYFSVHFVPYLYIIAAPFKVFPYSETVIVMNYLLMLSSIIPLYKLARLNFNDKKFGLFVAALLLLYPTFQYIIMYEFEMLRFSIPIILWMLYFWDKRNIALYYLFVVLAVFVREEVGLTIMMFGFYLILFERKRKDGLLTALIGVGAFVCITQFIMPALRDARYEHIAIGYFKEFGDTIGAVILTAIKNPLLVIKTFASPVKIANILMMYVPLLFVPFLALAPLLATVANVAVGLLSSSKTHTSYMLFYVSPSVPFIFYAFIKAWPKVVSYVERLAKERSLRFHPRSAAMTTVFTGIIVSNIFFGPSPLSMQFWFKDIRPAPFKTQNFHYSVYKINEHHRKIDEFVKLIPESAIVAAQRHLHAPLYKKRGIIDFPKQMMSKDGKVKPDYLLYDKTNNGFKEVSGVYIPEDNFRMIESDIHTWKLIKEVDGYCLYRRINK